MKWFGQAKSVDFISLPVHHVMIDYTDGDWERIIPDENNKPTAKAIYDRLVKRLKAKGEFLEFNSRIWRKSTIKSISLKEEY